MKRLDRSITPALSNEDIINFAHLCAFESLALGYQSHFCGLFEPEEWQSVESVFISVFISSVLFTILLALSTTGIMVIWENIMGGDQGRDWEELSLAFSLWPCS